MGAAERIYATLPTWAQHAAVTSYGAYWKWLRFGPGYANEVREFHKRDRFTADEWRSWQAERLSATLRTASTSVPFYARTWTKGQHAAARAGRLPELPLLEKDAVRLVPRAFVKAGARPWPELVFHTSGSTGTPIATIWRVDELRRSMALREVRSAGWASVSFTMPRGTFSGRMAEPDPLSRGPYHRFNFIERQAYFSPFHLRADTAAAYVAALRRHGIRWLTGYAVSHYLLARFILEQRLEAPRLDAVVTTSEKLTPVMRETIRAAYGCRVYEEYSTVENVVFASECERGALHVSPDCAVVEIVRADGSACAPEEPGEVVATSLMRDHQLMIRYRVGDVATWDPRPCACGRGMPVLKEVIGRLEDVVTGPDGRKLVRFHGLFVDQPRVREAQVIQETRDRLRIVVVPDGMFSQTDEQEVIRRVHQRLGPDVSVRIELVDHIARTAAGKFKAVVSLVADAR